MQGNEFTLDSDMTSEMRLFYKLCLEFHVHDVIVN